MKNSQIAPQTLDQGLSTPVIYFGLSLMHYINPHFTRRICFTGTHPWNRACGEQRIDDGLIEVIGLTTYQLPLLQVIMNCL